MFRLYRGINAEHRGGGGPKIQGRIVQDLYFIFSSSGIKSIWGNLMPH